MQGWDIIGAPSSAGAYAPGQEKAPAALRATGLLDRLEAHGTSCRDRGDVTGFRWQADMANPRAMNADSVARVATELAQVVSDSLTARRSVLVIGGDCTVGLGTVAGALTQTGSVGLVYFDLDTDLNTPASTEDGALDWMGVAHMLALEGAVEGLSQLGPKTPMLRPDQVHLFGSGNITPFEQLQIDKLRIPCTDLSSVQQDPPRAARELTTWAKNFQAILVHFDVDILDYLKFPLAENTRRNIGLSLDQALAALGEFMRFPNVVGLTITEINPDHGSGDGSTLQTFSDGLAKTIAGGLSL